MAIFNSPILSSIEGSIKSSLKNIEGRIEKMAANVIEKRNDEPLILKQGSILNNRYRVEEFFKKMEGCNVYLAVDIEGYKSCWGCGYDGNDKLDVFCNQCGVELSNRVYQILEADGTNDFSAEAGFIKKEVVHTNIIKLYDRFFSGQKEYLVTEYVRGAVITDKKYDDRVLREAAIIMADIVEYLHSRNISTAGIETEDFLSEEKGLKLANLAGLRFMEGGISHSRRKKDVKHLAELLLGLTADAKEEYKTASTLNKAAEGGFSSARKLIEKLEEAAADTGGVDAVSVASITDVGIVRKANEDSFGSMTGEINLFVVADGMGGHQSGDVASSMAVEALISAVQNSTDSRKDNLLNVLKDAVSNANKKVYDFAKANGKDMGTTIAASLLYGDTLYTANVGDSRAYLIRNSEAIQITKDHSLVARLVEMKMAEPKDVRNHPKGNVLLRTIGTDPKVDVDGYQTKIRKGDYLLLCTDGLWNQVYEDEIAHIVKRAGSLQDACKEFVRVANERGGPDNITAIVVKINN